MTLICCMCNRKEHNELWTEEFILEKNEVVSHGYCPHCFREVMEEIEELAKAPWIEAKCEHSRSAVN